MYTFDDACKNNIEFGEFSNEVLFSVVKKYPNEFLQNIVKEGINKDAILKELSSPVNDLITTEDVVQSIKNADGDKDLINEIISHINK
jgi:hypothetical protein